MLTVCVACVMSTRARPEVPWRAERRSREHSRRSVSGAANLSIYMVQSGRDADRVESGESRSPAYSLRFGIANSLFFCRLKME